MTIENNSRNVITRTYEESEWTNRASYVEGCEVEYIFEMFDPSSSNEVRFKDEREQQKAFFAEGWSAASRAQSKLDKLEADTNKNRATIDNRRTFHKMASEAILHMQYLEDQYTLGLVKRATVRAHLEQVYKGCKARVSKVQWKRRAGGGVQGYIPRCGFSVTALRAMANNALSILCNMGYTIKASWWMTNSKGEVVDHVYSEDNERKDMSGEDWARGIETMYYELD